MAYIFASARHDENGKYANGKVGDQLQSGSGDDYKGEVSMQDFYNHTKGWYGLRWKSDDYAEKFAAAMKKLVNDSNIGYDQNNRTSIMTYDGTKKVECDCGTLVRRAIKDATGIDVGNFTTANARAILLNSGLFTELGAVNTNSTLYNGDITVTRTKGHIGAIVKGNSRAVTTTKATCPYAEPTSTVKRGQSGNSVKWVQWHLIQLGYLPAKKSNGNSNVDGSFGTNTESAVKAFQTKYPECGTNGKPDGKVGAKSRAKLKSLV